MCDNGGNAEGGPRGITEGEPLGGPDSKVFLGMPWATLNNTPLWRYKHFTHEGGVSTPLIACWPAGIPSARNGKLEHQPGHLIDIMATAVHVAGAKYPTEFKGHRILPMEGVSLVPAFKGEPLQRVNSIFWEHEGNRAIRSGDWKLVMKFKGEWELYNIRNDRTERHNLVREKPETAQALARQWNDWASRSFVDDWVGEIRNDWGEEMRLPGPGKAKGKAKRK
jgi:arylsulfatase